MTIRAVHICNELDIPVKILTKKTEYLYQLGLNEGINKSLIAIGLTLTGCDELEPNASPTSQRINALKYAKFSGYKTFVSLEPIISFEKAKRMIRESIDFVDLYKIGLESGAKYDVVDAQTF